MKNLETKISALLKDKVDEINRPDLFRDPIVGFAAADDPRFKELTDNVLGDVHLLPEDILPGARTVISYFVPFTKETASSMIDKEYPSRSWAEGYVVINNRFPEISDALADLLVTEGYEAVRTKPSYESDVLMSSWANKSVAVIAEIGSFGLNHVIMTPKGSAGRFASVITTAEIAPSAPYSGPVCDYLVDGSCGKCIEACPADAIKADNTFDKFACRDVCNANNDIINSTEHLGDAETCGRCIGICPNSYL